MIDEYLKQILVSDYKDPTYTVVISSLDIGEECDHETITIGLKQYNPSIYDLLKSFYIDIKGLEVNDEIDLKEINDEATEYVNSFLDEQNGSVVVADRKLLLRSALEYDNEQRMYRSVLNATLLDGLPGAQTREKTIITSDDSDVFVFGINEDICIPLYLKTNNNEVISNGILMITLMDRSGNNVLEHKIMLVTDRNGHALYYPTALPTKKDMDDYASGTKQNEDSFYYENSEFYGDGIPRYLYYMRVDYSGDENRKPFSKLFKIYIAKGKKTNIDTGGF